MSNVLIGIIGVVLFIGLALAGALFLGPRFQEARQNADASAAIQIVAQIAGAVGMYSAQEGASVLASGGLSVLHEKGYLSRVPANPVVASEAIVLTGPIGTPGGNAGFVFLSLGTDADGTCTAIARQSGQYPDAVQSPTTPPTTSGRILGCFRKGTGMPVALTAGRYYAFAKV